MISKEDLRKRFENKELSLKEYQQRLTAYIVQDEEEDEQEENELAKAVNRMADIMQEKVSVYKKGQEAFKEHNSTLVSILQKLGEISDNKGMNQAPQVVVPLPTPQKRRFKFKVVRDNSNLIASIDVEEV
jgi:hypothetical protein